MTYYWVLLFSNNQSITSSFPVTNDSPFVPRTKHWSPLFSNNQLLITFFQATTVTFVSTTNHWSLFFPTTSQWHQCSQRSMTDYHCSLKLNIDYPGFPRTNHQSLLKTINVTQQPITDHHCFPRLIIFVFQQPINETIVFNDWSLLFPRTKHWLPLFPNNQLLITTVFKQPITDLFFPNNQLSPLLTNKWSPMFPNKQSHISTVPRQLITNQNTNCELNTHAKFQHYILTAYTWLWIHLNK